MGRLFKTLLYSASFVSLSVMVSADYIHQLATIDLAGNTVVIEGSQDRPWKVVFEGHLDNCLMNTPEELDDHIPNTFHQPLDDGKFAFACSNGYVYIAENGKQAEYVQLPTASWFWLDGYEFGITENWGFNLQTDHLWKKSPAYMLFNGHMKQNHDDKWLFVIQKGYLFIIDVKVKKLVSFKDWPGFWQSYLPMGEGRDDVDHTKPTTGLGVIHDRRGVAYLRAAVEFSTSQKKETKPMHLIQDLCSYRFAENRWRNSKNETIDEKEGDITLLYLQKRYSEAFSGTESSYTLLQADGRTVFSAGNSGCVLKCDTNTKLSLTKKIQASDFIDCNWIKASPEYPSPQKLKGLKVQPQVAHYYSFKTFEMYSSRYGRTYSDAAGSCWNHRVDKKTFSKKDQLDL
ncbi:hypothetical protein [Endozoicomonas lisbonensis]|uniref:Uncharacterized protein n=1 Tax=Endozoicomonas lisbonensis TaxID=3120522 RepID=A0ABV2SLQ0_9GAMM